MTSKNIGKVTLESPVNMIYGIGPEAVKRLERLEIITVYDLISYLPRRYNDWSNISSIVDYEEGKELSFRGTIVTAPTRKGYKRTSPIGFYVSDGYARIELSFFNSPYLIDKFNRDDEVFVHGVVTMFAGRPQLVNPHIELIGNNSNLQLIRPVYPLTQGVTSAQLSKWIGIAIKSVSNQLKDIVPKSICTSENLPDVIEAYYSAHFPKTMEEAYRARRRIAYEELILLGIGMKHFMHKEDEKEIAPVVIPNGGGLPKEISERWKKITSNLGFELTDDQKQALRDVQMDLMNKVPMNRLVQGDVGSGKTAVAILAMAMTALMGKQAVLLAPTSVLAKQHYDSATSLLKDSGINVVLLLGKTKASLKKEIKEQLKENEASVIIGTHAVLSDDVEFADLALVIADEQHRFGVKQREKLLISRKTEDEVNSVHNLVMTATPIPRTLAMVIYGDMATSIIKQKPKGRKEIKTLFAEDTDDRKIYDAIKTILDRGEQAYIVCSKIDENKDEKLFIDDVEVPDDAPPAISVMEMVKKLEDKGISSLYPAEAMYGSMKEAEKLAVMERFLSGETKILVSTTVIEVGVNNPNATMMVVMDADRFGLSTLHQLRGRIGRGDKQSYCILATKSKTEVALTRMALMCKCSDGFELAGKDLEIRGPGDFFGTRQHGIPALRAANLFTDAPIAKSACDAVNDVFAKKDDEAKILYENIRYMFGLRFKDKMGTL